MQISQVVRPNFRHNFIKDYYMRVIVPMIADKSAEFQAINARFMITDVESIRAREQAHVDLIYKHIEDLADAAPRWLKELKQLREDSDAFGRAMDTKFDLMRDQAKLAMEHFISFSEVGQDISSPKDLITVALKYPELF